MRAMVTSMCIEILISVCTVLALAGAIPTPPTPDLLFSPRPSPQSTLVYFMKSNGTTFNKYTDIITKQLEPYENENMIGEDVIDCAATRGPRRKEDIDKVCRFDITSELGPNCVKQWTYGYEDGMPCLLLKLDEIFDWMPQSYTNDSVPDNIRDLWTEYAVTVKCEGEIGADRDNMGDLQYFPSDGFHFKYFPYRNQAQYRPPLVFVQFTNPTPGILMMVTCRAYAQNINQPHTSKASVHFEVMVD